MHHVPLSVMSYSLVHHESCMSDLLFFFPVTSIFVLLFVFTVFTLCQEQLLIKSSFDIFPMLILSICMLITLSVLVLCHEYLKQQLIYDWSKGFSVHSVLFFPPLPCGNLKQTVEQMMCRCMSDGRGRCSMFNGYGSVGLLS